MSADQIESLIEQSGKENSLEMFVRALFLYLERESVNGELLDHLENTINIISDTPPLSLINELFERIDIYFEPEEISKMTLEHSHAPTRYSHGFREIFDLALKNQVEMEKRFSDKSDPYYIFTPAWDIEPVLKKFFNPDPAEIIGNYLKALFPYHSINLNKSKEKFQLNYGLLAIVKKIIKAYVIPANKMGVVVNFLINRESSLTDAEIIFLALTVPQAIFEAVLSKVCKEELIKNHEVFAAVLYLSIGNNLASSSNTIRLEALLRQNIPKESTLSGNKLVHKLPFINWELFGQILSTEFSYDLCHSFYKLNKRDLLDLKYHIEYSIKSYRSYQGNGSSPISAAVANSLFFVFDNGFSYGEKMEPVVILSRSYSGEADPIGLWEDSNKPFQLKDREQCYLQVIDSCLDEALYELSEAFLAFLLISQTFLHKGHIGNWLEISKRIDIIRAEGLSGVLVPTLDVLSDALNDFQGNMNSMLLRNMLYRIQPTLKNQSRKSLQFPEYVVSNTKLITLIGTENLKKLSPKSRQFLLDAEKKFEVLAPSLGVDIEEWGNIAIDFIKPIENELSNRLRVVYTSNAYKKQNTGGSAKPTFGSLIRILKEYVNGQLSKKVNELLLKAPIKLDQDRKLWDEFSKLVPVRNKAAHTSPFKHHDLIQLREQLFKGGLMIRFIDTLE